MSSSDEPYLFIEKMKKRLVYTLSLALFLFAFQNSASAVRDSGRNLLLLGNAASSLGRGGTGVSSEGVDLFYINPASIAGMDSIGLSLQYGTIEGRYHNPDLSLAVPTSYGVFGASMRMIYVPSGEDLERAYAMSLGGSKFLTSRLAVGSAVNLFYGEHQSELYYAGVAIGCLYRTEFMKEMKRGFGIYKPSFGFSLNAGWPSGDDEEYADFNQLSLGYSLFFLRGKGYSVGFFNDLSAINRYNDFPVRFGLEAEIGNRYSIRAGLIYPHSYGYGSYTAGLGYRLQAGGLEMSANYSLIHHRDVRYLHYLGIIVMYGVLDREPPVTSIGVSERYISPNYDGKQDFVVFRTDITDDSRIKGWKLQILDYEKRLIREFRFSERDVEEDLSVGDFFMRLWQKKESVVVPELLLWDGTDARGRIVSDGIYQYSFIVWDERDNISPARSGYVFVDTTGPRVDLKADDLLFSPNGDNRKDTIAIAVDAVTSPGDVWHAAFINNEGARVRTYRWLGSNVPKFIVWDGTDDRGQSAPEGLYSCIVESTDRAGNRAEKILRRISLTRQYEVADIDASVDYFSYGKAGEIRFFPSLSKQEGLTQWSIRIEDADGDAVKEIRGAPPMPRVVNWKVADSEGMRLRDGRYFYQLRALFMSGNAPSSFRKGILVDSTPPELSLDYSPRSFSPDGDGKNDMITIYPGVEDISGIREWYLLIYSPWGDIFKSFSGRGLPAGEINWDGRNHENELVESAVDYSVELFATDNAGNASKTRRIKIPIDILVMATEGGLAIRISNIEFAFNSAELKGEAFSILDRASQILNRYRNYRVMVEGHTDDIGEDEFNLRLSERRAKAVMDYLIESGVDAERLSFRGMGETEPYLPNVNDENRIRNRRVEFLLFKEDENVR